LHLENEQTTVYVTHDQVEAMALADRIAIMNDGVLQQVGTPTDVYRYPANLFVAQFIGSPVMNLSKATVTANGAGTNVMLGDGAAAFSFPQELQARMGAVGYGEPEVTLGVRPEGVTIARAEAPGFVPVEAHIIEPLGAYDIVDLKLGDQLLRARTTSGFVARPGDTVWVRLEAAQTHFFHARTGESLNIRLHPQNGRAARAVGMGN
jgi:multiple sugar transport system ATP-binding protein